MKHLPRRDPPYRPIEDYGIVGNTASAALVRLDGSIDWCCLPALDSSAVFAALLDAEKGGYFHIRPPEYSASTQRYLEATNVLVTTFQSPKGVLEVIDWMPAGRSIDSSREEKCLPQLHRLLRCTGGEVEALVTWAPRHDYAREATTIEQRAQGYVALAGEASLGLAGLEEGRVLELDEGPALVARLSMRPGETRLLSTTWDQRDPERPEKSGERLLEETVSGWRAWVHHHDTGMERPWAGERADQILRSELLLKLMTQPDSGAMAAAPTTSLPETLGGTRNWDYRYTWIRDAAQIAQAFFALGHQDEADAFLLWAEEVAFQQKQDSRDRIQILYGLRPESVCEEELLDHLEGYRHSTPVRIGNAAVDQLQLDVYGEILNAVYERARLSDTFEPDFEGFLIQLTREIEDTWLLPDFGIWEVQNGPCHFVYSRVMTWVALHRATWLSDNGYLSCDSSSWQERMSTIRAQVLTYGFDEERSSFVQRLSDPEGRLDAANLLLPLMEFLPPDDPRVQGTIDATLEHLTVDDLVYRYLAPDGLPGDEGAFVLCTFWLVDALTLSDRLDEAHRIYDGLMERANHLGLFAEQIDPFSGTFLGNFPQAYSHLGAINSTLYLAAREGRSIPVKSLLGMNQR